jgi:hypothetical protein
MFILFLALWYVEPLNHAFWTLVYSISETLGVSRDLGYAGWQMFRFWEHHSL